MSAKFNSEIAVIGIDIGKKLVSHRGSGSAWRDRAAAEVVARPNRSAALQPAAMSDRGVIHAMDTMFPSAGL